MRRFDELANAPSSASERKRRREKLTDQEVVKSAAKTQAVVQTFPTFSDQQQFGAIAVSPRVAEPYVPNASPAWDASAQRLSVGANAPLPRSALSSPQLSTLFASPDRVRKQSDEEKRCIASIIPIFARTWLISSARMKCKRWIALAVLSRVEDTINQYTRTKSELEHLKKHKVIVVKVMSCAC